MTGTRYKTLLRTLYGAAIHSRLSPAELKALAQELRQGRLSDELAYMIERALDHLGGPDRSSFDDERLEYAERLVRSAKISKTALASLLRSMGAESASSKMSAREMLERFIGSSSASRVDKLMELLASQREGDEFLAGISAKRE